jgi:hypothetical protein
LPDTDASQSPTNKLPLPVKAVGQFLTTRVDEVLEEEIVPCMSICTLEFILN